MSIRKHIEELDEKLQPENRHKFAPEELASMSEQLHNLAHIQMLWDQFEDIPMDPCLEIIEKPWYNFPAGTHRETIWRWFEHEFHISVAEDLMYETDEEEPVSTDDFKPYLVDYIRGELCRNSLDGTDDEVNAVISDIIDISNTSNIDPITKFVSIVSDVITRHKNAKTEYAVEMYNLDTNESYMRVETYTKQDDAIKLMNSIIDLSVKTRNDEYIGVLIKEIKHDADGNDIEVKTVSVRNAQKGSVHE